MDNQDWIYCPVCSQKTRVKIREDTVLINFPLYCPKCKRESLVVIKNKKMNVIKESEVQTQII